MRFALKEVDHLEKKIREADGMSMDESVQKDDLPPVLLPRFKEMKKLVLDKAREEKELQQRLLTEKVESLEKEIQDIQDSLKMLSKEPQNNNTNNNIKNNDVVSTPDVSAVPRAITEDTKPKATAAPSYDETKGAICPTGEFFEFPEYDGKDPPKEAKKAFAVFCNQNRKQVKNTLDESERKNKDIVNSLLKERYLALSDEEKRVWRDWASWEKKRYQRDVSIFERVSGSKPNARKRPASDEQQGDHIPKKNKKM